MDRIEQLIVEGAQLLAELQEARARRAYAKKLKGRKVKYSKTTRRSHQSFIKRPQYRNGSRGY